MPVNNLAKNTVILSLANFSTKLLGFYYTFLILNLLGDEIYGLYQIGLLLYISLISVIIGGFPEALSILVAQRDAQGAYLEMGSIFRRTRKFLFGLALTAAILFSYFIPLIVNGVYHDSRLYFPLYLSAAAMVILSISSCYRAYYLGILNMSPPALAQLAELAARLTVGIVAGVGLKELGPGAAVTGLTLGLLAGEIANCLVVVFVSRKNRHLTGPFPGARVPSQPVIGPLFGLAVPITLGYVISNLSGSIEAAIIPARLTNLGMTMNQGIALFGQLTGAAITIAYFPSVFAYALATSLMPAVSYYQAQTRTGFIGQRSLEAFRLTILTSLPFAIFFYVFPQDLVILFASPEAAYSLQLLALGIVFAFLRDVAGGIIQGIGKLGVLLFFTLVMTLLRLILIYILPVVYGMGIGGVALAYSVTALLGAVLNMGYLYKRYSFAIQWGKVFIAPSLAGLAMYAAAMTVKTGARQSFNSFELLVLFCLLSLVYLVVLILTNRGNRRGLAAFWR